MVLPAAKITQTDLKDLAELANTKLAPAQPYVFSAFAGNNRIGLPSDIDMERQFPGSFPAGSKVTARIYGYKTIAGVKTYSAYFTFKAFYDDRPSGSSPFALALSWTPVADGTLPDGYIVAIANPFGPALAWKDIGAAHSVTVTNYLPDGSWNLDQTLDAQNLGFPEQNLPCGHGAWLKTLNTIHGDLFTGLDIFGGARVFDESWLVSGPWCVSVAPKCYLYLGPQATRRAAYKNLKFIYSEADSVEGNQLARETDLAFDITAHIGANDFSWDANGTINGRIVLLSVPTGQNLSDWTIGALPPGVTFSFDPNFVTDDLDNHPQATAFIFDFTNVDYTAGDVITLTVTPSAGGGIYGGTVINMVFTETDLVEYPAADTIAIHTAGLAAKSAALLATLDPITFTDPTGVQVICESHHRCFCNGVFVANTLPTLGVMTFLDMDLPQYAPDPNGGRQRGSSQRLPRNDVLPYMPGVDYMASRWPVFRDTDFVPDNVTGRAVNGSTAWQSLPTKYESTQTNTDSIPPYAPTGQFFFYSMFVPGGAFDARFFANNPNVTVYVRAGDFPTLTQFDAAVNGGNWLSLRETHPGFATDTFYFIGIYNPTAVNVDVTTIALTITDATPPTGTFFPTELDDNGNAVAALEGDSFHFADPNAVDQRPIPLSGYCVSSLTVRRRPGASSANALDVKIGLMLGFAFESAGVFTEIQTITIPAGQTSATAAVFLVVLTGSPLACQCTEQVIVYAAVNFQPMMHSNFNSASVKLNGRDYSVGSYSGAAWYEAQRALLFFGADGAPTLLPIAAVIYNDLTAALNLL